MVNDEWWGKKRRRSEGTWASPRSCIIIVLFEANHVGVLFPPFLFAWGCNLNSQAVTLCFFSFFAGKKRSQSKCKRDEDEEGKEEEQGWSVSALIKLSIFLIWFSSFSYLIPLLVFVRGKKCSIFSISSWFSFSSFYAFDLLEPENLSSSTGANSRLRSTAFDTPVWSRCRVWLRR